MALASISGMPPELAADDESVASIIESRGVDVSVVPWNDPTVDWDGFDLVVARSTWDYTRHHTEFCSWVRRVGGSAGERCRPRHMEQ